jgi:molybdate-binding protein/DNA-binding XRE family transcriptional regulator
MPSFCQEPFLYGIVDLATSMSYDATIMAKQPSLENRLRALRVGRGWSQEDVARLSGLSRTGISAIETSRLVPSAAAALALAAVFECRVEDLFHLPRAEPQQAAWAWPPQRDPSRYWHAQVAGQTRLYPVEATPLGVVQHDGVFQAGALHGHSLTDPARTLVVACCDPAVGLLAAELARSTDVRLIALPRSSEMALSLLGQGLVHMAGVHLSAAGRREGNVQAVREKIGAGYRLLRMARWQEGIAFSPELRIRSVRAATHSELRWIGREAGSGARQCLDELLGDRRPPRRFAYDHRSVADAVRCGWAEVGVCLRLVSEEAGLGFLNVREEAYDFCYSESLEGDPRLQAVAQVVRSSSYRRSLGELPGYDSSETGELLSVR